MLLSYKRGQTSVILRIKILNSSVAIGAGLTGLTNASSGLIISTIADNEATATTYTSGGSTIDTIATLGTYAAPTSGHCRFKEVDATNHPGVYEIQLENARLAVASAKSLLVSISGPTNCAQTDFVVALQDLDPYDSVRAGLTALPNAAAGASSGLIINGSNSGTVTLAALTITGATTHTGNVLLSDGLTIAAPSTSNRAGITITGNGTGAGIISTGGTGGSGHGLKLVGGASSSGGGDGINATGGAGSGGSASGNGMAITGAASVSSGGAGAGIFVRGGNADASSGFSGDGISCLGGNANSGNAASNGIFVKGGTASAGSGGNAGAGLYALGGSGAASVNGGGNGIQAVGASNALVAGGIGLYAVGGNDTGQAAKFAGGTTGIGLQVNGGTTSGDGIKVITTSGHGLNLAPVGTDKHGIFTTGGNGGTSDGIKAVAGTGGVPVRGDITGNITGNVSGSVGSVTTVSDKTGYELSSAGVDAILDDTPAAELASVPTTTGSLRTMIQYLFQYFRNKRTVTATTETMFKEDASTSLGTATLSDDGTTFTKGESG